ncbi:MAG: prepilin peptidase [Sphingopyxis sp.]
MLMLVAIIWLIILLVLAAAGDLRRREISNVLNSVIAISAPLIWWASALPLWPDIALHVGVALAVFAVFAALFFIGQMGGGDVKLIGALALWINPGLILPMLLVMTIVGGVIAAIMLVHKKIKKIEQQPEVPYGVAIAIAGLWAIHQQYINHLSLIPTI